MNNVLPIKDHIQNWIKAARTTQKHLALQVGMSETEISRYMHGRHVPNLQHLTELAHVIRVPLEQIAEYQDTLNRKQTAQAKANANPRLQILLDWIETQTESNPVLAQRLGISLVTLLKIRRGDIEKVNSKTLVRLANAGVPFEDIPTVPEGYRHCSRCWDVKLATNEFWPERKKAGRVVGLDSICRECRAVYSRHHYQVNPDYQRRSLKASKRQYAAKKAEVRS